MKQTFKNILIGLSLLAVPSMVHAQEMVYNEGVGGVTTGKGVSGPNKDGSYTIKLESWAVGESDYSENSTDIVLVLDRSLSMKEPYNKTENKTWTVDDFISPEEELYYREWNNTQKWYDYYGPLTRRKNDDWWGSGQYEIYGEMVVGTGSKYLGTSYTGELFKDIKLPAMKAAVKKFIGVVNKSDKEDANGNPRGKRLGNRIAIVIFGSDSYTALGGWVKLGNDKNEIDNEDGFTSLNTYIDGINADGGTRVDLGINAAKELISSSTAAYKTVVLFTDGIPGGGRWNADDIDIADDAIDYSNDIKGRDGKNATVWTVGLFEDMSTENKDRTDIYMNRVSSNYYNVTSMTSSATAAEDQKYYLEVSGDKDLEKIFEDIAQESTDHETIDGSTQVRDVLTSSFTLPDDFTPSKVRIYTEDYHVIDEKETWNNRQDNPAGVSAKEVETNKVDENGNNILDENGNPIKLKTVQVEGFDFSKDDSAVGVYDGNWVGPRKVQGVTTYAGKRLVIEFEIEQVAGITGGAGTATNTTQSGIYKKNSDGTYENINPFKVPHPVLSVNIVIKKSGLRHGESATFEIERCRPKNWDESKTLEENLKAMEYNALGKPIPSVADDGEWENWSKVIVTNKGNNGDEVVKTLVALDPYYVYRVAEDTWGWAYDLVSTSGSNKENTSTVEINPFKFKNTEKENTPKHAEAVTVNHFNYTISGGEFDGKQAEYYKSSKERFSNETN